VKLLGWPQPAAGQDRHDVLQLSACLHQHASSVQQLAAQTHIEVPRVQLFASALVAAGLAKTIPAYASSYPVGDTAQQTRDRTGATGHEAGKLRGFLSKLRHQFGL